jgi:hypothetical protein
MPMRSCLFFCLLLLALPARSELQAQTGWYGEHLALAFSSDETGPLLTGLYDRAAAPGHCRFHLYGRPQARGWRVLLDAAGSNDRLLGRMEVEGETLRLLLARAPRGCEAIYQTLTARPEFSLSQARDWQSIRRVSADRAHFHQQPDRQSRRGAYVVRDDAVALLQGRAGYVDAVYLAAGRESRGWLAEPDLAPPNFSVAAESFWQRPLPGLSAPATVAERERWRAWLDWSDECESRHAVQRQADDGGLNLISFGPRGNLLRIACGYLAYQEAFIYAWLPPGRLEDSRLLVLPGFDPDRGEERVSSDHSEMVGLDEIDRTRGELRIFSKYRGAGDCGQWLLLTVADDGLVLREWRERGCDDSLPEGAELPPPERWPVRAQH